MKRILVPVDFSATSVKAFRFACLLASKVKGSITLYHVAEQLESPFIDDPALRKRYNQETAADAIRRMHRMRVKVCGENARVPVAAVVGKAPVVGNILSFASTHHMDLIVMGTQGATGIKKVIVGSVAARMAEKTTLPLLLVPARYRLAEPEVAVFAADPDRATAAHLQQMLGVVKPFKARVDVVQLVRKTDDPASLEAASASLEAYVKGLKKELRYTALQPRVVACTDVVDQMERLHKTLRYDLLTMVRRQKTLLERLTLKSFTQNMAYVTTRPLLVLPE
ncbi:MAG TPA: universal stress protein [Lacibacter sp.]|nr:universal stress protein [Lacibacter sp.]